MKKYILYLVPIGMLLLFSCSNNQTSSDQSSSNKEIKKAEAAPIAKKYDIKSGIITFETLIETGGMKIKTKQILYFDDYGNKESREDFETDPSTGKEFVATRNFVKDGFRYTCSIKNKGGVKSKAIGQGIEAKFSMKEASTQTKNQFKNLSGETIAGKVCEGFSMVTPSGNIAMYGWNHILLKNVTDNASMKIKSETVATKIEENVSIPADKFEVPADVKMTDY